MIKYIYFLLIIFYQSTGLSSQNFNNIVLNDECSKLDFSNTSSFYFSDDIENIEIKFNNGRAWIKNLLKASANGVITEKFKKKYKAKLIINYKDKISCIFNAKIKLHGDGADHHINTSNFLSSLDVELLNGNIKGIVKFKLYLGNNASRHKDYETFYNTLLSEMGFLAPRTSLINVKMLSQKSIFIFQEKIVKEFIEYNNLRESFLIEGNENLIIWNNSNSTNLFQDQFVNTKINNLKKFDINNIEIKQLVYEALNTINHEYLNFSKRYERYLKKVFSLPTSNITNEANIGFYLDLTNLESALNKSDNNLYTFEALMFATNSQHSLIPKNRKFYYDYIGKTYKPIFYDSSSGEEFDKENIPLNEIALTRNAIKGSDKALKLINNINFDDLYLKLSKRGLTKSKKILYNKIENIKENLKIISNISLESLSKKYGYSVQKLEKTRLDIKEDIYEANYYKNILKNNLLLRDDNLNYYFTCDFNINDSCKEKVSNKFYQLKKINLNLVFKNNNGFITCNINLNCKEILLTSKDFSNLIGGKYNNKNKINIFAGNFENYKKKKVREKNLKIINIKNYSNIFIDEESLIKVENFFNIYVKGSLKIEINNNKKTIKIYENSNGSFVTFFNGVLNNWKIEYEGQKINSKYSNLITGCVNFHNITINNSEIISKNSNCEDAINFINSNGNIKSILVENAISDAIDFDFSNLDIDKIVVNNAGNDCLDVSSGNYRTNKINLKNCGDKGISVGEKSYFTNNYTYIKSSNIAVASKDSSRVYIENIETEKCKIECFAAYRKKQEFNGGYLEIKNTISDSNIQIFEDKFSKIVLK